MEEREGTRELNAPRDARGHLQTRDISHLDYADDEASESSPVIPTDPEILPAHLEIESRVLAAPNLEICWIKKCKKLNFSTQI